MRGAEAQMKPDRLFNTADGIFRKHELTDSRIYV
jgi:hypothetical protein